MVFLALEVAKVPTRRDEVRAHTLNGLHKHALAIGLHGTTVDHQHTRRLGIRPESMHHVSIRRVLIFSKVTEASFRTLTQFPALSFGRAGHGIHQLDIVV